MSTHLMPPQRAHRSRLRSALLILSAGLVTTALAWIAAASAPNGAHAVVAWYSGSAATAMVVLTLASTRELRAAVTRIPRLKDEALQHVLERTAGGIAGAAQEIGKYRDRVAQAQTAYNS
jgi:hypothetical protein